MRTAMTIKFVLVAFLFTLVVGPSLVYSGGQKGKPQLAGQGKIVAQARGKKDELEVKDDSVCRLILILGKFKNLPLETAWIAAHTFSIRKKDSCIKVVWGKEGKEGGFIPGFIGGNTCPYCKKGDFRRQETKLKHAELKKVLDEMLSRAKKLKDGAEKKQKKAKFAKICEEIEKMSKSLLKVEVHDVSENDQDLTKKKKTVDACRKTMRKIERKLPRQDQKKLQERIENGRRFLVCPNKDCRRLRFRRVKVGLDKIKDILENDGKIKCFSQVLVIYHGEKKERTQSVLKWLALHIDSPINRLILWSCYGSRQITAEDLTKYFKHQKDLLQKNREEIPCPCRCNPEVFTAENLFLEDNAPQIVENWIVTMRKEIANLNNMIAAGENPKRFDQDAVQNWKDKIVRMKSARENWLNPRLSEAKKPGNERLRKTGLSMPLGIDRNCTVEFVLQAPTLHFRRYIASGGVERNVVATELFDGVTIKKEPLLVARGILSEYNRLGGKLADLDPAPAKDKVTGKDSTKKKPTKPGKKKDSPEKLKQKIEREELKKRTWERKPAGTPDKEANLRLLNSSLKRLRAQLEKALAAEKIDPK